MQSPAEPLSRRLAFAAADHNNEEPDTLRMVQSMDYKLCFNRLTGARELYDLTRDPTEQQNIAARETEIAEQFMKHLEHFMTGGREGETIAPRSKEDRELLEQLGY
jgi:hypothetical protein